MPAERPFAYERDLADFFRIVEEGQRDLMRLVQDAILHEQLETAERRRLQLAKVIAYLDQLGAQVDAGARQLVARAFTQSAQRTRDEINALNITTPTAASFVGLQTEALDALQASITGRLQATRQLIGRNVEDLYAKAGRRTAVRAILGADGSPRAAQRQLATELLKKRHVQQLMNEANVAFVDTAGRGWKLNTYTQMVTRTVTRQAVVQGAIARMTENGITVARVSVHAKPCPICAIWQGRLVSLNGEVGDYQGEAVTSLDSLPGGGPPMHPNCKHTLSPVSLAVDQLRDELQGGPPQLPPANADTPQTVSDALHPDRAVEAITRRTSAAINKVHATHGLPDIPVTRLVGGNTGTRGAYYPRAKRIAVRTAGPHPELTLAHEIGHMLDHLQLPGDTLASQANAEILRAWHDAVNASDAVAGLQAAQRAARSPDTRNFVGYLLRPVELFARSYAQWIATRSGDLRLAQQLEVALQDAYPRQWSDEDFAAIGNAFDALFSNLGLKR